MINKRLYESIYTAPLCLLAFSASAQPQQKPQLTQVQTVPSQTNKPTQKQVVHKPANTLQQQQVQQQVQQPVLIPFQQKLVRQDLRYLVDQLPKVKMKSYDRPQIQIALILDVSGSMEGLLNQARAELWKVINLFNDIEYLTRKSELLFILMVCHKRRLGYF